MWNVNAPAMRLPHGVDRPGQQQPGVLVLQVTKRSSDKFPQADITAAGWHSVWFSQATCACAGSTPTGGA